MLVWFAAGSAAIVWFVFRDAAIDYRVVMAGSLVPLVAEAVTGRTGIAHSLVVGAAALVITMLVTRGRRQLRRRALGIPIGMLLHLVLDFAWTDADTFWWPLLGELEGLSVGLFDRPLWASVALEVAGLAIAVTGYRRLGLADPEVGRRFAQRGVLPLTPVEG